MDCINIPPKLLIPLFSLSDPKITAGKQPGSSLYTGQLTQKLLCKHSLVTLTFLAIIMIQKCLYSRFEPREDIGNIQKETARVL